jgi:hypothetical protein
VAGSFSASMQAWPVRHQSLGAIMTPETKPAKTYNFIRKDLHSLSLNSCFNNIRNFTYCAALFTAAGHLIHPNSIPRISAALILTLLSLTLLAMNSMQTTMIVTLLFFPERSTSYRILKGSTSMKQIMLLVPWRFTFSCIIGVLITLAMYGFFGAILK